MAVRRALLVCSITAIVAIVAVFLVVRQSVAVERIAAGVTVAGLDVSGLTVAEATARLRATHARRLRAGAVTVSASDLSWRLSGRDAHVQVGAQSSAERALAAGRRSGGRAVDVPLEVAVSERELNRFTRRIERRLQRRPRDARLRVTIGSAAVTPHVRGRDVDQRRLRRDIVRALRDPRLPRRLRARVRRPAPPVTTGQLRRRARTVITIEQSTFTLRLLEDGAVVRRYRIAVGQPEYPTPSGLFSIVSKQVDPVWSVPNSPWAGELAGTTVAGGTAANPLKARWMGIVDGVGIHGTDIAGSIGTRASHGCIRMLVPDVIELFDRVPVGTPVLIV